MPEVALAFIVGEAIQVLSGILMALKTLHMLYSHAALGVRDRDYSIWSTVFTPFSFCHLNPVSDSFSSRLVLCDNISNMRFTILFIYHLLLLLLDHWCCCYWVTLSDAHRLLLVLQSGIISVASVGNIS